MWSCINNVIGCSNSPSSSISKSSLHCINEFFQTVAMTSQHRSANCFCTPSLGDNNGFSFDEITTSAVLSRMNKLDVKKLTDLAGLSAFFSKEIANEIVVPLTNLFNHSLRDGIVPAACKQSHITAVHKGGDCNDPSRPEPIILLKLPIMLLRNAPKISLLCSNYA